MLVVVYETTSFPPSLFFQAEESAQKVDVFTGRHSWIVIEVPGSATVAVEVGDGARCHSDPSNYRWDKQQRRHDEELEGRELWNEPLI